MSYAEQLTDCPASPGLIGRLLNWFALSDRKGSACPDPAELHRTGALGVSVATDIALTREFCDYNRPASAERGSQLRLHTIAGSIASTLPG